MKLRQFIVMTALVCAAHTAAAQDPNLAPQRRAPSLAAQLAVEHRAGLAPWLDVREEKRQYYAYRNYAPPEILAQLDRPVASAAVRNMLATRSAAFHSGTRRMRLTLDADSIVNVGADAPDSAGAVALVDLARSPDLWNSLSGELQLDADANYIFATLANRFARDRAARGRWLAHDTLMVSVAAKDHSRVRIYELTDGAWRLRSDLTPAAVPAKDPTSLRRRMNPRTMPVYYQGIETVAVEAARTSIGQLIMEATIDQFRELATRNGYANPRDAAQFSTPPQSNPPAGSQPPPPTTYQAYGQSPWCTRQCSVGSCLGCCAKALAAEHTTIFAASVACHVASDLCPWCHAGCAAMTAAMSTSAAILDTMCVTTCPISTRMSLGSNPNRCPAG